MGLSKKNTGVGCHFLLQVDSWGTTNSVVIHPYFYLVVAWILLGFSAITQHKSRLQQKKKTKPKRNLESNVICIYILCETGFLKHWGTRMEKRSYLQYWVWRELSSFLPNILTFTYSVSFCQLTLEGNRKLPLSKIYIPVVTGTFGLRVQNEAGQRLTEFC